MEKKMDKFYSRSVSEYYDDEGTHYSHITVKHRALERTLFDYVIKENYHDGSVSVITKSGEKD